jgi:hypothetical protein
MCPLRREVLTDEEFRDLKAGADTDQVSVLFDNYPRLLATIDALKAERVRLRAMLSDEQLRIVDAGRVFDSEKGPAIR